MEWYPGRWVEFIDPSRDDGEEQAILVADLESSGFLVQLESFVDAVHRFKASRNTDDPRGCPIPNFEGRPPQLRRSRNPPRRSASSTQGTDTSRNWRSAERTAYANCAENQRPSPMHRTSRTWSPTTSSGLLTGFRQSRKHCCALSELSPKNARCERCEGHQEVGTSCRGAADQGHGSAALTM